MRDRREVTCAWVAGAVLSTVALAPAQSIDDAPAPPAAVPATIVLEHVEAPTEIALGTMAVNVWASLRLSGGAEPLTGATLVLGEGEGARTVEMRALDGALDSPVEEVVATVDTYAWVRDGVHEWELRAGAAGRPPEVVGRGAIRVKGRVTTPDLVLFDARGGAESWIGSGAGGFTRANTFESGVPGFAPVLADCDGDRLLDVVWPADPDRVVVWKNRGAGRFEVMRTLDLGGDVACGAVGDVDGDGKVDLVTAYGSRTLQLHQSMEDPPEIMGELTLVPERIALAQLEGDPAPEICLALLGIQEAEIQVWRTGKPAWTPTVRLPPPPEGRGRIRALVPSPRPAGGLLLISATPEEGLLESWEPAADIDSVSAPVCRTRYRVSGEPLEAVAGRFAEDVPWVVAVREKDRTVLYGVQEREGVRRLGSLEGVPETMVATDLDGDGDDDLVTGGSDLRLWINVRGEEFREAGESPYALQASVVAIVAGNLDERGS